MYRRAGRAGAAYIGIARNKYRLSRCRERNGEHRTEERKKAKGEASLEIATIDIADGAFEERSRERDGHLQTTNRTTGSNGKRDHVSDGGANSNCR